MILHYFINRLEESIISSVGATSRSRPGGRSYKEIQNRDDTLLIRNGITFGLENSTIECLCPRFRQSLHKKSDICYNYS